MDRDKQQEQHETLEQRVVELGSRYLKENVKWLSTSLTPNNFAICKTRLLKVLERCRDIGFDDAADQEIVLVEDLKEEYEKVVRAAFEREEQARIRAQIREEQVREREIERELLILDLIPNTLRVRVWHVG